MKKTAFLFLLFLFPVLAAAQFSSMGKDKEKKPYLQVTPGKDTVYVFLFNGITNSTDLTYEGTGTTINWYKYSDLTTPFRAGTRDIYPDDASGYVLEVDGKKMSVWVLDYKKYLPVLNSIEPNLQSPDLCTELILNISANIPDLQYQTLKGDTYSLPREFSIKYATKKWENNQWASDSLNYTIELPKNSYTVTTPLANTQFILSGDQYAHDLGIDTIHKQSELYVTPKVECHITTIVTDREAVKNEDKRPRNSQPIDYSAPIEVQFLSNANEAATYYNWTITRDSQLVVPARTDKDLRYTFTDYGTYQVKCKAISATCSSTDSIKVNVHQASIKVPNVFTPNGDGLNDEFRVAYKSLLSFECWIYNRWGRKVFYWNNPEKGWDGRIGGKEAAEGPYFYVIKATGYGIDLKKNNPNIKSTITLHGNINLLRGLQK